MFLAGIFLITLSTCIITSNLTLLLWLHPLLWFILVLKSISTILNHPILPSSLKNMFTLDTISIIHFFRITSLLTCIETIIRCQDVEAFYSNNGVFPIRLYDMLCTRMGVCDWDFGKNGNEPLTTTDHSIHLSSGTVIFQYLLFLGTIFLAMWSMYQPSTGRLTGLYILTSSMHRRNHFINDKGSETLRVLLLWSMLLSFTVYNTFEKKDPKKRKSKNQQNAKGQEQHQNSDLDSNSTIFSSATIGFIFQISMLYWFSALYKYAPSGDDSWSSGQAIDLSLALKSHQTKLGHLLLLAPSWTRIFLTHASGALESIGPLLFLCPWHTKKIRCIGIISFIGFHLGIGTAMDLGIFPVYSCCLFIPLMPKEWWWWLSFGNVWMGGEMDVVNVVEGINGGGGSGSGSGSNSGGSSVGVGVGVEKGPTAIKSTTIKTKESCPRRCARECGNQKKLLVTNAKGQLNSNLPVVLFQQIFIVIVTFLIFWWQTTHVIEEGQYDTVLNMPLSYAAKESCSILGIKQHWKVFTNLSTMEGNFNCRPIIIGVVGGNTNDQDQSNSNGNGNVEDSDSKYINLLNWKKNSFLPQYQHGTIHSVLEDYNSEARQTSSYLWDRWTYAIRSNDYLMISTGDYFCRLWERETNINMTLIMDNKNVNINTKHGLNPIEIIRVVTNFCTVWGLNSEECQQIWQAFENVAKKQRMQSYYYLSVCEKGLVHGIRHDCLNDLESVLDERMSPTVIQFKREEVVEEKVEKVDGRG